MATFQHGLSATLSLPTAIEGVLESAGMDLARELAEARPMGGTSVIRLPGLRSCTFTAEGLFDETIDALLFAAWDGIAAVEATFSPDGGTTTYVVNTFVTGYNHRAASNAMSRITVNLSSTGDVERNPA